MVDSRILVVTPTYNERPNIGSFITQLFEALPQAHCLIVDDNSPDGTGELAEELAAKDPRVRVIHRPRKLGLGSAYLQAFERGLQDGYDVLIEMDADHSHNPRYLPGMLAELDSRADLIIGSRNIAGGGVDGWGFGRHVLSKGGSLYSRMLLGVSPRDLTSGYKIFRREVLEAIDLQTVRSEGYSFQIELTYRAIRKGFTVREFPIVFVDRHAGKSKMSRRVFAEAVMLVPKLRVEALLGRI
ncbi:MAG: polyprenol monophosphomannose synthase [Myxococcota bacterium]